MLPEHKARTPTCPALPRCSLTHSLAYSVPGAGLEWSSKGINRVSEPQRLILSFHSLRPSSSGELLLSDSWLSFGQSPKSKGYLWSWILSSVMGKLENASWIHDPLMKYLNSTEEYLAHLCGPKRSDLSLPVSVAYALIFVVGVMGNLLVCLVIVRHQTLKTPTNYYLFSLAVSDLLVLLLGMPLEVYEMWHNYPFLFGPVGCYFKTALFETVCFASILSVTTVSIERYVAIIHPFRAKLESTRRRALRILSLVWSFSVVFALPNTSIHGIKFQHFPNGSSVPGSATCTVTKPMWVYNFIIQATSFLFYILPMTLISVLYYLMGLRVSTEGLA